MPEEKWTDESGWVELWAAPRGYTVSIPKPAKIQHGYFLVIRFEAS